MTVTIEERKDYELYARKQLITEGIPFQIVEDVMELVMSSFDDGVRFAMKDLKVEVE